MAEEVKKYLDYEGLKHYNDKLQKDLDEKIGDLDVATENTPGLVMPGDGLTVDESGELSIDVKEDGGLKATEDGLEVDWDNGQKAGAATLGMVKVGDGLDIDEEGVLSVEPKDDSGIEVDAEGVSVKLKAAGGLKVGADGIEVNVKSTGGVSVDQNGVAVDWTAAPKASSTDYGMVKLGDGLTLNEDGTIEVDSDTIEDESIPLEKIEGYDDLVKKDELGDVYEFKGSVDTLEDLASKESGAKVGDVYNVKASGMNYGYVESGGDYNDHWDALGATFSITSISNAEIDKLFEATVED